MAENIKHQANQEAIRNLLSPYLDGEVSDEERTLVDQAISTSPELQQELESLRQTVALVVALAPMPAPRPFTLSEADLQAVSPAPKKQFGLPSWVSGLAMLAAALVCVLAVGGVFLSTQFSQLGAPAGEVARVEDSPLLQTAEVEAEQAPAAPPAGAAVEEAAKEEPEERKVVELEKEGEAAAAAPVAEEEVITEAEPGEDLVGKEADTTAAVAGQTETAESEDTFGGDADQGGRPDEAATVSPQPQPLATLTPQPTATAGVIPPPAAGGESPANAQEATASQLAPAPAEEPASEETGVGGAIAEAEEPPIAQPAPAIEVPAEEVAPEAAKAEESPGLQAAVPPADEAQEEQDPTFRQKLPRSVEIQNQQLQVQPGLIHIAGFIEVEPGTPLVASLRRNQSPFDEWADPAGLRSVAQSKGQFSFSIQPKAGRTDKDLFAMEPANYQITITSAGVDAPVVATVFFDTLGLPATPEQATTTSTPPPAPTPTRPKVQPTVAPPAPPATAGPVTPVFFQETQSQAGWPLLGVGLIALVTLILAGIIVWLKINRKI